MLDGAVSQLKSEAKPAKANDWRSDWNLFKVSKAEFKISEPLGIFKIADFALQEDPFCTKSKILAKGGVARRAKPEVRRVRSFSEVGSPKKSWLNVKFFWGRQSQKRSFCVPFRNLKRSETRQGERLTERLKPFRFQKRSSKLVSR